MFLSLQVFGIGFVLRIMVVGWNKMDIFADMDIIQLSPVVFGGIRAASSRPTQRTHNGYVFRHPPKPTPFRGHIYLFELIHTHERTKRAYPIRSSHSEATNATCVRAILVSL